LQPDTQFLKPTFIVESVYSKLKQCFTLSRRVWKYTSSQKPGKRSEAKQSSGVTLALHSVTWSGVFAPTYLLNYGKAVKLMTGFSPKNSDKKRSLGGCDAKKSDRSNCC